MSQRFTGESLENADERRADAAASGRHATILARIDNPGEFEDKGWSADAAGVAKAVESMSYEQKNSLLDACSKLNRNLDGAKVEIAICDALEASPNIAGGRQGNSRGL